MDKRVLFLKILNNILLMYVTLLIPGFTFDKRSGTTDKGKDYEDYLIVLLSLKLTADDSVANFKLASNDKSFGTFDDIIADVTYKDQRREQYAIQVKHKQSVKVVSRIHLSGEIGNFSIQKYFQCYQEIRDNKGKNFAYVRFTCASFKDEKYFKIADKNKTKVVACKYALNQQNLINTSGHDYVYKFAAQDDANPCTQFFKNFYFYPNQKDLEQVQVLTSQLFKKYSPEEAAFYGFVKFVRDWSQKEGRKKSLNKTLIMKTIGNLVIKPFLRTTLVFQAKLELLKELCFENDITILDSCERSEKIFKNKAEDCRELEDLKIVKIGESERSFIYNGIVLILKSGKVHFLLIGENLETEIFKDFTIFHDLTHLEQDTEIYQKISKLEVSLQGRTPVLLSQVLKDDDDMRNSFTTSQILEILLNTLKIGEGKEELPVPYKSQVVLKPIIGFNFLNKFRTSSLCVLSCSKDRIEQLKIQLGPAFQSIADYLRKKQKHRLRYDLTTHVIVAEDLCSFEDFQQICSQNPGTTYHHFRLLSNDRLEWLASNGSGEELIPYQIPRCAFRECDIITPCNRINVICSQSGMGKSVMLKYLKNNLPSTYWILYVRITNHVSYLKESQESQEILQHLLEYQNNIFHYSRFELNIRERFVEKKRLIILWDGIDEIADPAMVQRIIKAIQDISASGFISWVTARHYFQSLFMKQLSTFPILIQDLTKEKQAEYIKEFLSRNLDEDQITDIILKITNLLAVTHSTELLGIPLHLHILGLLFRRNAEKYSSLIQKTFTLADMIRYFVKESINFAYVEKNVDINVDSILNPHILKGNRRFRLQQYEMCALQTYLVREDLEKLRQIIFSKQPKITEDDRGILTNSGVNGYTFFHNSCGHLYKDAYRNIRTMFDIILCRNCPVHLAILHRNFDAISDYKDFDKVDEMGRTSLHLACSYGQTHPPLLINKDSEHEIIDFDKGETVCKENDDYKNLINFLLDSLQLHDTYHWNSLKHALVTFSLYAVEAILKHAPESYDSLKEIYGCATLVFYSVRFHYQNIFDSIGSAIPYFESQHSCNILHQISRWGNRSTFLEKVLKNETYVRLVNKTCCIKKLLFVVNDPSSSTDLLKLIINDIEGEIVEDTNQFEALTVIRETPLHFASLFGNYRTVQILTEYGADINCLNNGDYVPLHYAVSTAQVEIVKFLVEHGALLNKINFYKENELHHAVRVSSREIVAYLLAKGSDFFYNHTRLTPLDIAIAIHQNEIGHLLLGHLFNSSGKLENILRESLHFATISGNVEIMENLISYRFHVDKSDKGRRTPLHMACSSGQVEAVKLLIKHKSDVNKKDENDMTPLHCAAFSGNVEIMHLLQKHGADINSQNKLGETPLHIAVCFQKKNASNFLLRNGADINKKDNKNETPIQIAREWKCYLATNQKPPMVIKEEEVITVPRSIELELSYSVEPLQRICWQSPIIFY